MALNNQHFRNKQFHVLGGQSELFIEGMEPGRDVFLTVQNLSKISRAVAEVVWKYNCFAAQFSIFHHNQGGRSIGVGYWGKRIGEKRDKVRSRKLSRIREAFCLIDRYKAHRIRTEEAKEWREIQ